jgi:chromatin segregation and condensation protein Rec8/ScpA/Scc1 (kleisin family)
LGALFYNFNDLNDRPVLIATFMALLELIRQGRVRALQERRYGPILLERREQAASGETPPPAPAGGEQQQ